MPGTSTSDCRQASEFFNGSDHFVWIGADFITPDAPTLTAETLTVSGAVSPGTNVTITLASATTNKLWKNQRIRFGTAGSYKVVELAADYAVGVTEIVAKEVKTAIGDTETASVTPVVPYYSVRATSPNVTGETLEIRNAGACDWSNKIMLKRMHSNSVSGSVVANDPGYAILKEAACSTTKRIFMQLIKADDTSWEGNYWVQDFSNPQETDTDVKADFSLEGDGDPAEDTEYAIA